MQRSMELTVSATFNRTNCLSTVFNRTGRLSTALLKGLLARSGCLGTSPLKGVPCLVSIELVV